jgi:hypothetical protein
MGSIGEILWYFKPQIRGRLCIIMPLPANLSTQHGWQPWNQVETERYLIKEDN